ncbi:MAG: trypsin-like peptidase domain-containing protein [Ardenticatenaceae bacterium]|nr:trypsin-like peptidase domain-containing protein [Ardenticatenaceae bacterium]
MKGLKSIQYLSMVLCLILLVACGGGGEEPEEVAVEPEVETQQQDPTPEPTDPPPPTEEPEPSGLVTSLEEAQNAVVQIVAEGTFMDFDGTTQFNSAGSGTGFIIDPAGIAVTNNHVVTGAALLRVYVPGEDSPRNAKILGVSECSDLALIDIDGDDFPYMNWYQDDINVGLDVYAAGYPLGDPEFTLTRGIVSKAAAGGDTDWASVDAVLEHDATINPGNSGGPLLTADGEVVGVNYAGSSLFSQYFAVARDEALEVIESLQAGNDYESIGINGVAVSGDEGGLGIWVSSVKSGSPADVSGIIPGDILYSLEGLLLAQDGTMSDYCDILRSRNPDDTMNIEVIRTTTEEFLEGQLNGRELESSFSFAATLDDTVEDTGSTESSAPTNFNYVEIEDNTGLLRMEVPDFWSDVDPRAPADDSIFTAILEASPDLESYKNTWGTPGVFFGVLINTNYTPDSALDEITWAESCEYSGRFDYEDPLYVGKYDLWTDCGGDGAVVIEVAVFPEGQTFLGIVEITAITEADLNVADRILETFIVDN